MVGKGRTEGLSPGEPDMTEAILYRCRARVRSVESLGDELEAWKKAHDEALRVREWEGWVREALEMNESAAALHQEFLVRVQEGLPGPLADACEILFRLLVATEKLLD